MKGRSCALRFSRPPICARLTSVGVATGCGPARHKPARRATQPRRRAYTGPPPPIPRGQHQAAQWGAGGLPGWGPPSPLSPPPAHAPSGLRPSATKGQHLGAPPQAPLGPSAPGPGTRTKTSGEECGLSKKKFRAILFIFIMSSY